MVLILVSRWTSAATQTEQDAFRWKSPCRAAIMSSLYLIFCLMATGKTIYFSSIMKPLGLYCKTGWTALRWRCVKPLSQALLQRGSRSAALLHFRDAHWWKMVFPPKREKKNLLLVTDCSVRKTMNLWRVFWVCSYCFCFKFLMSERG